MACVPIRLHCMVYIRTLQTYSNISVCVSVSTCVRVPVDVLLLFGKRGLNDALYRINLRHKKW